MDIAIGYNVVFRIVNADNSIKLVGGMLENSFDITGNVKETITKADQGVKRRKLTGYDYSFGVKGLVSIRETGEVDTYLDKTDIINLIRNKTELDFVYGGKVNGDTVFTGTVICEKYSESSNATDEPSYDASFVNVSALTQTTLPLT